MRVCINIDCWMCFVYYRGCVATLLSTMLIVHPKSHGSMPKSGRTLTKTELCEINTTSQLPVGTNKHNDIIMTSGFVIPNHIAPSHCLTRLTQKFQLNWELCCLKNGVNSYCPRLHPFSRRIWKHPSRGGRGSAVRACSHTNRRCYVPRHNGRSHSFC